MNDKGEMCVWENLDQATSELLQHEIDHLQGILSFERADPHPQLDGSVVSREKFEENKGYYHTLVDFHY